MFSKAIFVFFLFILVVFCQEVEIDAETRLMSFLLSYDKRIRPVRNTTSAVNVTFGIAYVQLIELNDRDQTLVSNIWIRQKWKNDYLKWDPIQFNNVTMFNIDATKIWVPDIVLYNSAISGSGDGLMYKFMTKVQIKYNGFNEWYAPIIMRSSCKIDTNYFPFDTQNCQLMFGSWTFDIYELDIFPEDKTADTSFYLPSAEFDLLSVKADRDVKKFSTTAYSRVVYNIHVRRQPGFFLFNVILPGLVVTFFAILTFVLPVHTGERIGLIIEAFLTLSFLCMMVGDSIPINGDVTPLITKFLIVCMSLISWILTTNLISVNLTDKIPVPRWIHELAFTYIGPMIGYCPHYESKDGFLWSYFFSDPLCHHTENKLTEESFSKHFDKNKELEIIVLNKTIDFQEFPDDKNNKIVNEGVETDMDTANLKCLVHNSKKEFDERFTKDFWRCFGQVVDRSFGVTFTFIFIVISAVLLVRGYDYQRSIQQIN